MDLDLASVQRPLMYLYGSNTLVILLSKTPTCQLPILLHLTQLQTLLLLVLAALVWFIRSTNVSTTFISYNLSNANF